MSEIGLTTSETNVATGAASPALSQWRIAAFWLPLAASWLLMTLEGPFVNGTMARLSDPALMIAAFGITLSLSITIESPVIMLLATATALARDRQSYLKIRRFTIDLMVLTTALTALIGWTPLYDIVVRQAMGIPTAIADAALPGLRIMLLWSAAIAWRRFKQGVMIRHNATRLVGYGTIVRLVGSAGTAAALGLWGKLPGVWLGACALMVGVIAEAVFAHFAAAPVVARVTSSAVRMGEVELTYNALVRYHAPLAATTLLLLLGQPIVGAALARTAQPELALAAWPVTYGLVLIFRSPGAALPEAVIALLGGERYRAAGAPLWPHGRVDLIRLVGDLGFHPPGKFLPDPVDRNHTGPRADRRARRSVVAVDPVVDGRAGVATGPADESQSDSAHHRGDGVESGDDGWRAGPRCGTALPRRPACGNRVDGGDGRRVTRTLLPGARIFVTPRRSSAARPAPRERDG
ncbi:MAG: hypothetical protein HY023_08955 [Chloroflexi bacterium]|nr:hypothetical protein [Chloroflexota bacterium]